MPKISIKRRGGIPTLFLGGEPIHFSSLWFFPPRGNRPWNKGNEITYFRDAGIRIYNWFELWEEPVDYKRKRYGFAQFAANFEKIRAFDPDGLFLVKASADAPEWWKKMFPEELEKYHDTHVKEPEKHGLWRQSYASKRWREDIQDYLSQLVTFVRGQSWGEQVISVMPCGGDSCEWMNRALQYSLDYSEHMQSGFREWLRTKYGRVSALRQAWKDRQLTFSSAAIPARSQLMSGQDWGFRDPVASRQVIDYLDFMDELVADCVIEECKAVREAANGYMFTGTYFDKSLESYWPLGFWQDGEEIPRQAPMFIAAGNGGLMKILESLDVQAIASPYSYVYRGMGGDAGYMQLVETCHLHNKYVIFEDDARHSLSPIPDGEYGKPATPEETITQITRNFGNILCRGTGLWWGYPWNRSAEEGDWNNAKVMKRVRRLAELGRFSVTELKDRSSVAEVGVIVDTESENWVKPDFLRGWDSVIRQRIWELSRMGTPYDTYHLADLVKGNVRKYKLLVFLNAYVLSEDQTSAIHQYLATNGATALWIYAPGYLKQGRSEGISLENMTKVTGIRIKRHDIEWPATVTITDYRHPVTKKLPGHLTYGWRCMTGPVFYADDSDAETLGTLVHYMGKCEDGLVLKNMGEWTSVWSAVPAVPACLLREIARNANVHIWAEDDDVVYAGRNWLAVHTLKGGECTFRLPFRTHVHNALTGRVIRRNCKSFEFVLKPRSSEIFFLGKTLDC